MLPSFPDADTITWSREEESIYEWSKIIATQHMYGGYIKWRWNIKLWWQNLDMKPKVLKNIGLMCGFKLWLNVIRNKKQACHKLGVVHLQTSWMTVVMYLDPHSGWLICLRSNYPSGFFMAYTNIIWCTWQRTIGITKFIATATLKVHKWHVWNVCVRLVNGLHEPYQALPSASMGNGDITFAG